MSVITYQHGNSILGYTHVRTNEISREAVYTEDQTTFLHELWRFDIIALLNPQATSIIEPPLFEGRPGETDTAFRNFMLQPRGQLRFTLDDGTVLLECPRDGYIVDAHNGPTPRSFDILDIHGTESIYVRWVVECHVNECREEMVVLAHRWRMGEDIDQDSFSTRTIEGQVIFRTDMLYRRGVAPDDFRSRFFHPVPDGMKRTSIRVWVTEDGSELRYRTVDTVQSHNLQNFGAQCASRIKASQTEFQTFPDDFQVRSDKMTDALMQASQGNIGAAGWSLINPAYWLFELPGKTCPQTFTQVTVKAWGTPQSSRKDLERLVVGIAFSRVRSSFKLKDNDPINGAVEWMLHHELDEKYVEFRYTVRRGQNVKTLDRAAMLPDDHVPKDEKLYCNNRVVLTDAVARGSGHPNDGGARGSWIGEIISQFLASPCRPPHRPANYYSPQLRSQARFQAVPPDGLFNPSGIQSPPPNAVGSAGQSGDQGGGGHSVGSGNQ